MKSDIKSLTLDQIEEKFRVWGQPAYRATQLAGWLYRQLACDWDLMTNLPRALRDRLANEYTLNCLGLVTLKEAADGTRKFLWRLHDGNMIESVLIPANPALYGEGSDRTTLCVSTQVGCAYRCAFCASGLRGLKRDLATEEIVEQVLAVERWHRETSKTSSPACPNSGIAVAETGFLEAVEAREPSPAQPFRQETRLVDNIVVMGMGEPLANYENLLKALHILNAPWATRIGARRITISTAGLAPRIRRLADEQLQVRLAISLHAATDDVRSKLMPVNRKHPLGDLMAACKYYVDRKGKMITFEYLLIEGVNDGPDQVKPLAAFARRLGAKINLIPYNPVQGLPWKRPSPTAQRAFHRALKSLGVTATLRQEKGSDIDAACGQLRLRTEAQQGSRLTD